MYAVWVDVSYYAGTLSTEVCAFVSLYRVCGEWFIEYKLLGILMLIALDRTAAR